MRILHLTHTDLRYDNRILKEIEALSEINIYNVNAIGVELNEKAAYAKRNFNSRIKNIKLFTSKFKALPRPFLYLLNLIEITLVFLINSIKVKPQIIHCHDTMVLPVGVIIKIIFKSKLIYDAHELESNKNGQSYILSRATYLVEKLFWNRIDHFITVSQSILNWYSSAFGNKPSTLILNSPIINPRDSQSTSDYFHKLYKIPNESIVFVYIGFLGFGRSIENVIEVFLNKEIHSHVVFIGYGDLYDYIFSYQSKVSNIHLHDAIAHDDVVNILNSADIAFCLIENVSLSDYYCLPNKLFEYIFAGVPIIASDFPDISALVNKYNLGQVCTLDLSSILSAVKDIQLNPPKRITTDLADLTWSSQARKLKLIYESLSI